MIRHTVDVSPESDRQILLDARAQAQRLVAQLEAQREDLDRFTSAARVAPAPEKLDEGRQALARAIDSARRTLRDIEQALKASADEG